MTFVNKILWILKATSKQQLSTNWKFHIPDLKVGTLDQLVGLSDDLGKNFKKKKSNLKIHYSMIQLLSNGSWALKLEFTNFILKNSLF